MCPTIPKPEETLEQSVYRLAAHAGVELLIDHIRPTLRAIQIDEDSGAVRMEVLIVPAVEGLRMAAAHLREIADAIEAAADKPRPRL